MQEGPRNRKESRIDFLEEDTQVTLEIVPEALQHFPVIHTTDRQTGKERYAALWGSYEKRDSALHIKIIAVYQETTDTHADPFYKEGVDQVEIDYGTLLRKMRTIENTQGFEGQFLLGDVHTHPQSKAYPSEEDLRAMLSVRTEFIPEKERPVIFGIIGEGSHGQTVTNFYRVVRVPESPSGFGFKLLD